MVKRYKYSFMGFSFDFDSRNNNFSKYLRDFDLTHNYIESDFLFIGSFINQDQYNDICKLNCVKILYITEPIEFTIPFSYRFYCEDNCDYFIGCVENNYDIGFFACPFFVNCPSFENIFYLDDVNETVKNCNNLFEKRYCALVNRHDNGATRVNIYNKLKDFGFIECPSSLLNNCSSKEIDELFNVNYYKFFQFNICPENYMTTIPGYITEKLWYTCLSGAIPIYYGYFSENEEKIFNKERILFYNPRDDESMEKVKQKVEFLLKNPEEFLKFYQQPVFCDTAYETIKKYELNMYYLLKTVYQKLDSKNQT